ncbi:23S rRNA (cytidine2498-2'-O)-methyltransferase [Paenibacillus endophyticus]|uniref:23S rRNA (Cytidine2498-2'-O)-methyltransferase n=1 Tax=Paenibacillus endophyticus TaxID=1294268 RepID=A0A7W5G9F2_9BACL|nr:SAM-dependent methyltransferase [Paenibacillus endophyticus]MBB3151645.1 23S rRNA (cytidine2498-2'-O)-methyltransferase [Paenibacillus endophyticus]
MSQWIGTANQTYAPYAMEELRRLVDGVTFTQLAAGEVFLWTSPLDRDGTLQAILQQEPIFLRHMQPVDRTIDITGNANDLEDLSNMVRNAVLSFENKRVAVHIRRTSKTAFMYTAADTKAVLDAVLEEIGAEPVVQLPDIIIAIYAAAEKLYVGLGAPADMLSDWPGGAVRFQREEGQVSRAKFKLLEAEREFKLNYADYQNALDVGAAPGGWTSLLLERGLRVTAIDPAELHPSLMAYPTLTYLKRNASEVKFNPGSFDLLVCDMSWSPMLMCKLVLDLEPALKSGATAIITVKLMHRKPLQTIRDVISRLSTEFRLQKAKQLFHNREEITLHLIKK